MVCCLEVFVSLWVDKIYLKNICKYIYMHAFNSIAMINNHIICMIFVPGIVLHGFKPSGLTKNGGLL